MKKHITQTLIVSIILTILVIGVLFSVDEVQAANIGKQVSNNGLIGWWTFDEGTSTIAHDFSGQGNHGILTNSPAWIGGKKGKALQFVSAANTSVKKTNTTTYNRTTGQELTVAAWIKPNWGGGYQDLVANRSAGTHNWILYQHTTDGSIQLHGSAQNKSTYIPPNNVWTYIVATVDTAGNYNLYANGQVVQSTSFTYNLATPSELTMGNYGVSSEPYNGSLDDVRIYNRALSSTEIATLYGANSAIKKGISNNGMAGWWRLDEGTSTIAHDFSGLGNNGVFSGSPLWVAGKKGAALQFNGSSQSVNSIPTNSFPSGTNPISMFAWIKTTSVARESALSYGNSITAQAATLNVNQLSSNGRFVIDFYNTYADSGVVVNDGRWHHVGFSTVGNTTAVTMYVDGVAYPGTLSGAAPNIAAGTNAQIGRWITAGAGDTGGYYFNGSVDEPRVYNRVVTTAEVQALYKQNQTTVNASQNTKSANGLVGLWSFDGKDIDWRANKTMDQSGSGNNGIFTNLATSSAPVMGKVGQALNFNGSGSFIAVNDSNSLDIASGASMTIATWIKRNVDSAGYETVLSKRTAGVNYELSLNNTSSGGSKSFLFYSGASIIPSATLIPLNKWTHIAAVTNATGTTYFLNGDFAGTAAVTTAGANTDPLFIGTFGGQFLKAALDDVRIYSRALSVSEIKQLYLQGK